MVPSKSTLFYLPSGYGKEGIFMALDLASSCQHFHPWPKASLWPLQSTLSLSMEEQKCQGFTAPSPPQSSPQPKTERIHGMSPPPHPAPLPSACRAYSTRSPRVPSRIEPRLPTGVTFSVTHPLSVSFPFLSYSHSLLVFPHFPEHFLHSVLGSACGVTQPKALSLFY